MLNLNNSLPTHLACGATDLRKSIDGLSLEQPKAIKKVNYNMFTLVIHFHTLLYKASSKNK
ncbi:hypothetical protein [Clostridium sp.]|uniref:hypothetical protein n=1 Tax=Clostridium sp. TaxID=1506 RepID=UPI00321659FD